MDHRSRQMAFFSCKRGAKGWLLRYVETFWNKKGFSLLYKTNRFHVAWCCRASDSVIDHERRQNVVRTSVTHSATPRVPLFCSYQILTSSVIYTTQVNKTFRVRWLASSEVISLHFGDSLLIIIHQIFSLACNWSKHVTWSNFPIGEYSPIFKTANVAKKISWMINTIASIWGENLLGHLSLDIICSSKLTIFRRATPSENCSLLGTDNVRRQTSEHIFAPNGDYCLYIL